MKTTYFALSLLLAAPLFAANDTTVPNTTNSPPTISREQIEAKVLKVYSGKDGNAEFKAYAVMWKGQEVVVGDMFAESNYKEGDTIQIVVVRLPVHRGEKKHEMLQFQVMRESRIPVFKPEVRAVQTPAHNLVFF
jgi:uncharacterized protein (UPF0218 family)